MKKKIRLSLHRETLRSLDEKGVRRVAGGEYTFACSDNPCDTGLRDCTIAYNDTFGAECQPATFTNAQNCFSGGYTACC